jgi:cation/acetate symporter
MIRRLMALLSIAAFAPGAWAGEALTGEVQKQPLNVSAILMFVAFVGVTLCITYWAGSYRHLRAHETCAERVFRLLL